MKMVSKCLLILGFLQIAQGFLNVLGGSGGGCGCGCQAGPSCAPCPSPCSSSFPLSPIIPSSPYSISPYPSNQPSFTVQSFPQQPVQPSQQGLAMNSDFQLPITQPQSIQPQPTVEGPVRFADVQENQSSSFQQESNNVQPQYSAPEAVLPSESESQPASANQYGGIEVVPPTETPQSPTEEAQSVTEEYEDVTTENKATKEYSSIAKALKKAIRMKVLRRSPLKKQVITEMAEVIPPRVEEIKETSTISQSLSHTSPTTTFDPKCNSEVLRKCILDFIQQSTAASKRKIQKAAVEAIGGRIDVICSMGTFSYIVNTELYCEAERNGITCFAFRQAGN